MLDSLAPPESVQKCLEYNNMHYKKIRSCRTYKLCSGVWYAFWGKMPLLTSICVSICWMMSCNIAWVRLF